MKTRSIHELLIILKDNKKLFETGLCLLINDLWDKDEIDFNEQENLVSYIAINRPKRGKHYNKSMSDSGYHWPRGEWPPRLAWLNDQIEKLTKKEG